MYLEILAKISLRMSAGKCNSNRAIYLFALHVTVVGRCDLAFSAQTRINQADYTRVNNNKQFRGIAHSCIHFSKMYLYEIWGLQRRDLLSLLSAN